MRPALSFSTVPDARRRLLHTQYCGICAKVILADESAARNYIGLILKHPRLEPGTFALAPYRCPQGSGWHVGRNSRTLRIDFKAGRVANAKEVRLEA